MDVLPGDIVLIKNFQFADGVPDVCDFRPCLVMDVKKNDTEEYANVLIMTQQMQKYNKYQDAFSIHVGSRDIGLISLNNLYEVSTDEIHVVVDTTGKDFFRISRDFQKAHHDTDVLQIKQCLQKLAQYEKQQEKIENILVERAKGFRVAKKNYRIMNNQYAEEDPITKKLQRKKRNHYRLKREKNNLDY